MRGRLFGLIDSVGELHPFDLVFPVAAFAEQPIAPKPNLVKVAAVQDSGYDKGELPRDAYLPVESLLP